MAANVLTVLLFVASLIASLYASRFISIYAVLLASVLYTAFFASASPSFHHSPASYFSITIFAAGAFCVRRLVRALRLRVLVDAESRMKMEALQASEANFRMILDTIPALIWSATPQGIPLFFNKRMLEFVGISEEELEKHRQEMTPNSARHFDDHPDDVEKAVAARRHSLLTGTPLNAEYRVRRFDGTYRWVRALGEPHRDETGAIVGWYGVDVDIDESKRQEEKLHAAQSRLDRASQIAMVAELSASISHELNQPLTAVLSNGEACRNWLLAQPPNLERARIAAEDIIRDGARAGEIVRKVKALFQHAAPNKSALDLREVVSQTLLLHEDKIERAAISVETQFDPSLSALMADRVQIQQVFSNLILNAIDAMKPKTDGEKVLRIRIQNPGPNETYIEIQDTGCGMEDLNKVFDPFFTTKSTGMGVGLSVCRSIIESHGGRIWPTSTLGVGTTFSLTLPTR